MSIPLHFKITNGIIKANIGDKRDKAGLAKLKKPKKCKNSV